jgi:Trypsin-like peptidase domain
VVDCDGLENRWGCKLSGGSNPSPSASLLKTEILWIFISDCIGLNYMHRALNIEELYHPISSHIVPVFAFRGDKQVVGGTAVLIAPLLAFTAKHVIEHILHEFGSDLLQTNTELDIYLIQPMAGCIWYVSQTSAWIGSDICLLRLHPRNDLASRSNITRLSLTVDPPAANTEISAIGYPSSKLKINCNDSEYTDLMLDLQPTISTGRVSEVHREYRDSSMLPFPCFSVEAHFSSGMSGGAVFNEKRQLCGLVCNGGEGLLEGHSNAVSIWPSMLITTKFDQHTLVPASLESCKEYNVLDLAKLGYLDFHGHDRIEFFTHENGSAGARRFHW